MFFFSKVQFAKFFYNFVAADTSYNPSIFSSDVVNIFMYICVDKSTQVCPSDTLSRKRG